MIGKVPEGLEPCLPRLRFILVDINRLKPWELKPADNLAVQLYRLERSRRLKKIERVLLGLFEELTRPGRSELLRAFLTWLRRVRMPSRFPGLELPALRHEEKSAMLEERVQRWTQEWREEGREYGRSPRARRG